MSQPQDGSPALNNPSPISWSKKWLPGRDATIFLAVWLVGWGFFAFFAVPAWADHVRDRTCSPPKAPGAPLDAAALGIPPSGATLTPAIGIARGVAVDSTSWPAGQGAPAHTSLVAGSSSLVRNGGGGLVPSEAVEAWVRIDAGTSVLSVCADSKRAPHLANGTYAGFVAIPTTDPTKTLTVRQELAVQSTYAADFWPLGLIVVAVGLMLVSDKLDAAPKPVRWVAVFTGGAAFVGAYYSTALANPSWGGPKAIGTLIVTVFTATTGAVTAAAAAARGGGSGSGSGSGKP